ncbi:hypothetical protein [Armatimonas sp.]
MDETRVVSCCHSERRRSALSRLLQWRITDRDAEPIRYSDANGFTES